MRSRFEVTGAWFHDSKLSIRQDPNASRSLSEVFEGQRASFGELTDVDICVSMGEACYLWRHHKSGVILSFCHLCY